MPERTGPTTCRCEHAGVGSALSSASHERARAPRRATRRLCPVGRPGANLRADSTSRAACVLCPRREPCSALEAGRRRRIAGASPRFAGGSLQRGGDGFVGLAARSAELPRSTHSGRWPQRPTVTGRARLLCEDLRKSTVTGPASLRGGVVDSSAKQWMRERDTAAPTGSLRLSSAGSRQPPGGPGVSRHREQSSPTPESAATTTNPSRVCRGSPQCVGEMRARL